MSIPATLTTCPRCAANLKHGFSHRASSLDFIKPEKFQHFAFTSQDVGEAGLRAVLPSKAAYFRAYLCHACELYIVDYSRSYSREEANAIAATLT